MVYCPLPLICLLALDQAVCHEILRYKKGNSEHPFLHKFKQCFLTNISVNYTGEGVYATYDDASPISMQLDLSFKELEPIYDVDYDDAGGVGF